MHNIDSQGIIYQLRRIANALEKANSFVDFTKEDKQVKSETQAVKDATGRLPSDNNPQPKDTN